MQQILKATESDHDDMNDSSDSEYYTMIVYLKPVSIVTSKVYTDDTASVTDNSQPAIQALGTTGGRSGSGHDRSCERSHGRGHGLGHGHREVLVCGFAWF